MNARASAFPLPLSPRGTLGVVTLCCCALLAGAWWFELVMVLTPCKLCLQQRWPHYVGAVIGAAALLAGRDVARPALAALAVLMLVSFLMGGYHAGVEWGWFAGPNDCAGASAPAAGSTADFLRQLQTMRVVSCTEAAWRLFGLSLAGWNAIASLALAAVAVAALPRR